MKRLLKFTCTLAAMLSAIHLYASKTFFTVRPHFQSATPERVSLFRNLLLEEAKCCNGWGGAVELVPYYSRTTRVNGSEMLAHYFLPDGCNNCCLNVKEYNFAAESGSANPGASSDYDPTKQIEARNFNLATVGGTTSDSLLSSRLGSYSGTICFKPEQRVFGLGICYKQVLTLKCDGTVGLWFEGSLPVERVRNTMGLREVVENNGGGSDLRPGLDGALHVGTMTEAFRQRNWKYGKIDCRCEREKWGIADVELKIGYNYLTTDCASLNTYFGLVVPTGTKVVGDPMFQPIVGNNRHWGVLFGNNIAFRLYDTDCWSIDWFFDTNVRYLFQNHQIRSFDLIGKHWSRYIEMYASPEQAYSALQLGNPLALGQNIVSTTPSDASIFVGTSGINLLTQCVKVRPHAAGDFNTAYLFTKYNDCGQWLLELGYNLYARQAEVIELENCNLGNPAVKDINGTGITNRARNIRANFAGSGINFTENYLRLTACDLDLQSAAHPGFIMHSAYGSLGFKWDRACPVLLAVGGSFEFAPKEVVGALERWTVWTKLAFTF